MGLKILLEWYDKSTGSLVGKGYSKDLRDDGSVIEELGLKIDGTVNNGEYDVEPRWVGILQRYFTHRIELSQFDYFVAFEYRDEWPEDMRTLSWELHGNPAAFRRNDYWHVPVTPDVSGEVIRIHYTYHGNKFPRKRIWFFILGTEFDCDVSRNGNKETIVPKEKFISAGQSIDIKHAALAKGGHGKLDYGKPLELLLEFYVRMT